MGGGGPGGAGAGVAHGVVYDDVAEGAFEGVHLFQDREELGVFGDGLAFCRILQAKGRFVGVAGGGDGGGPSGGSAVAFEQGRVGGSARGSTRPRRNKKRTNASKIGFRLI